MDPLTSVRGVARRIARDERGLSLIELMTVMVSAIILALAFFAIQDMVLRQTNRVFARVDATQSARIAMENLESRMHSACVSEGVTPIQQNSTGDSIRFISKYGAQARLTPDLHVVTFNPTANTLVDQTFPSNGGVAPNYTFATTATSTKILADNVSRSGSTPIFQYYAFGEAKDSAGNSYVDAADNPYVMLLDGTSTLPDGLETSTGASVPAGTKPFNSPTTLATPLNAANAKIAAAVNVTMVVGAGGKLGDNPNYSATEPTTVQNTIGLRITPPPADGPLQTVRPCG
jgi:Tfp pilus assembly protein PilE